MLDGIYIKSKVILKTEPYGHGTIVTRARRKVHLMERPPGRKARASETLCGITISWRPFSQARHIEDDANCRRCLGVADAVPA